MAIGVLSSGKLTKVGCWLALSAALLTLPVSAEDQIKLKNGQVMSGQILGFSNGMIMFSTRTSTGGTAKLPWRLDQVDTVTMTAPAAVSQLKATDPNAVVAALAPQVTAYAGLPVDWVVDAMGQLAEAYTALGQSDKADAMYSQIDTLYPGSKYHYQAVAGRAKIKIQQGKAADALADLQPIVDEANKNLAPSQAEGGFYARVFLVYGQALEAQKQPEKALGAYLTVKTMFYQNASMAEQSDQLAKKLQEKNPGVGVE